MSSRQTNLNPKLRLLAAFVFGVFLLAQTTCFAHCTFGSLTAHGKSAEPSCHQVQPQPACHDTGDSGTADDENPLPPLPSPNQTCATLKNMVAGGESVTLSAPVWPTLYFLAPLALSDLTLPTTDTSADFRRSCASDWVFTPEVSLGPAFHSLAPPVLL